MVGVVLSRLVIICGGLLYPAYNSYKAVKAASLRDYVRWIMYWVVFAIYSVAESFADIFLSWFPFYYTIKIMFVLWLSSPYTRGSTLLYRKLIHPNLARREQEIDLFLENAKNSGYQAVVDVSSKGLNLAANAVVTAAVKSQAAVTDKLRSYSVMDIRNLPDDMNMHDPRQGMIRNPQMVRERLHTAPNPIYHEQVAPHSSAIVSNQLGSQFQAYSMFDLSNKNQDGRSTFSAASSPIIEHPPSPTSVATNDDNELHFFDNQAPTHTNDDMRIPRRTNYAQESVAEPDDYATHCRTMPKSNRSSHEPDYKQIPPMPTISHKTKELRRSKRRQKTIGNDDNIKEE